MVCLGVSSQGAPPGTSAPALLHHATMPLGPSGVLQAAANSSTTAAASSMVSNHQPASSSSSSSSPPSSGSATSNTAQVVVTHQQNNPQHYSVHSEVCDPCNAVLRPTDQQQFHTPSFGDEEFEIPPFSLHSFSGPVSQAHQTLYSHNTHPLSHPAHPGPPGATQPLTHHPRSPPVGYTGGHQSPHLYNGAGGAPNGVGPDGFVIPKFPPQNIDIPDITGSGYGTGRLGGVSFHGQFTTGIYPGAYGHPQHPQQQQQQQQHNQQQHNQHNQQQHSQQQQQYGHNHNHNHAGAPQNPAQQHSQQHNQQQGQQQSQQQSQQQQREPILTTIGQQQQQQQQPIGAELGQQQPNGHQPQQQSQQQHGQQQVVKGITMDGRHLSPSGSTTTSPGRESSEDSDDSLPLAQLAVKRTAPASPPSITNSTTNGASASKKPKAPKKRKKKDPNEPHKPVSAYALFFRDTQAAIKGQSPNASFGEVSKIVASMWDNLDADQKSEYKKKTETAKKEYLKQLAAYRASLVSKQHPGMETMDHYGQDKGGPTATMMQQHKGIMPVMPQSMSPNMMPPNMSPNNMPSPPTSHMSPPHLTHLPDGTGHMMPHQQPMGGMHSGPHQMGVPHQQPGMSPLGGHRPQGMGSPQGPMGSPMHMNNQGHGYALDSRQMNSPRGTMCIRQGCQNHAVANPAWDNEYCSNACVVTHCRDVFTAWVAARQSTNSYASVK